MRATSAIFAGLAMPLAAQAAENVSWPWQTFKTTNFAPPELNVTKHGETAPGYFFFNGNGPEQHNYSLFIMSEENDLIYQHPLIGEYAGLRPHYFKGEPVLAFWNGISFSEPYGFGYGIIQLLNNAYESIYNITLYKEDGNFGNLGGFDEDNIQSWIDMHESKITPEGTIFVTMYNVTQHDLSSVGGPEDGWVTDSLFYEIDIETDEVLFSWSALEHVDQIPISDVLQFYPIEDFGQNKTNPYGYFHINSVERFQDGSYLISSRFFSSIFKIATDGNVEWTLQGKDGGDFEISSDISFRYQHDARILKETPGHVEISLFNNDNSGIESGINVTTGIILSVDEKEMKAELLLELEDPADPIYAHSQGNTQALPNGNFFMSHGSTPKMKEYSSKGDLLMSMQWGPGDGNIFSYRGYKFPWVGLPKETPAVYSCASGNKTEVYMSWNGATEHKEWKVYAGDSKNSLKLVKTVKKDGYETSAIVSGSPAFVQVEARGHGIDSKKSDVFSVEETC